VEAGHADDAVARSQYEAGETRKAAETKNRLFSRSVPEGGPTTGITWKEVSDSMDRFFSTPGRSSNLDPLPGTQLPMSKVDKMFRQIVANPGAIGSLVRQIRSMYPGEELDVSKKLGF
jgi:hypothetical protein